MWGGVSFFWVKMSGMRKRSGLDNQKKTYECTHRVTVLGLVCEKMANPVALVRQEEQDRRVRRETTTVSLLLEEESGKSGGQRR